MANEPNVVEKKVLQLKALLGDDAAKSVLDQAAEKEKLAQKAGVEFKEKKTVATKAKAKVEPVSLKDMLAKIEEGLEGGTIVNDLEESEDEVEAPAEKEATLDMVALKQLIGEVFDEKLSALVKDATTEKEVKPDPKADEQAVKTKEIQDQMAALTKQLADLQGDQPKSAGFRASQSDTTVVKESSPKNQPGNSFDDFVSDFVMGIPAKPGQP